jgi:ferrochelatase
MSVICMAYGSPDSLDDVEPYLQDIRGGRPVTPQAVAALRRRYEAIGGRTPLREITQRCADALDAYVGMKHWHPRIADTVERMLRDGADSITGIVLAPHDTAFGTDGYETRLRDAVGGRVPVRMIRSWWREPSFIELIASRIREHDLTDTRVFFTAHSLPVRVAGNYPNELRESVEAIGIENYEIAYQSESSTGEPWLGPDVAASIQRFQADGGRRALVVPIGFVSDHLEILYDLDVVLAGIASSIGVELRRTRLPNDDPAFISVLRSVLAAQVAA